MYIQLYNISNKPTIDIEKRKDNVKIKYKENIFDVYEGYVALKDITNSKCITTTDRLYNILKYSLDRDEKFVNHRINKISNNKQSFILTIDAVFDREEHKIVLKKQTDDLKIIERKIDYLLSKEQ